MHRAVVVFAVLLGLVAVLATPASSPVYLGSATSASMAPTIQAGDGYVVVGAGQVAVGDVVVFSSPERGGYVTHRVVGESPEGFVTRGDANPSTDQETGMAPVPRSAIVGKVLSVGGSPLVVPGLGTVVGVVDDHGFVALALVALAGVALGVRDRRRRDPHKRQVLRIGDVVPPLLAGALTLSVAAVLLASSSHVLYLQGDLSGTETTTVTLDGEVGPFTQLVVEADGVTIEDRTVEDGRVRLTLSVPPESQGSNVRLLVRPYPGTLPRAQLEALDGVHPLLAAFASIGVVLGPLVVAYWLLLDPKQPLRAPLTRRAG